MPIAGKRKVMGDFTGLEYAPGCWRLIPQEPEYFSMTGSEVSKKMDVPFPHKLIWASFYIKTSADVVSTGQLQILIGRDEGDIDGFPKGKEIIMTESGLVESPTGVDFDNIKREGTTYRVKLTAGNTDVVYPIFYLETL